MNKLFKVCAVVISAVFVLSGTAVPEEVDETWTLDIGQIIAASTLLTVQPVLIATGVDSATISFTGATAVGDTADPWVIADQYLRVAYSSNYGSWGVRIVSDNVEKLNEVLAALAVPEGPVQFDDDTATNYLSGSPYTNAGDPATYLAYSGLLRIDVTNWINPNSRAILACQFNQDPLAPLGTLPTKPTTNIVAAGVDGEEYQHPDVGAYGDPWTWMQDKTVYLQADPGGANQFDGNIYQGDTAGGDAIFNDNLIVFGSGPGGGVLRPHQEADPDVVDAVSPVVVYLAARYGATDYGDTDSPFVYLLGAGNWSTRIVIEVVNE